MIYANECTKEAGDECGEEGCLEENAICLAAIGKTDNIMVSSQFVIFTAIRESEK